MDLFKLSDIYLSDFPRRRQLCLKVSRHRAAPSPSPAVLQHGAKHVLLGLLGRAADAEGSAVGCREKIAPVEEIFRVYWEVV